MICSLEWFRITKADENIDYQKNEGERVKTNPSKTCYH